MTAPSPKRSIPASDAIRFQHVSVRFGGVQALDDVSFSVGRGEVHCLAGENGSGKSTLIKVIAGVYQAAPGARTDYFGESVAAPTPQLARRKGVAVIWQDLALFPEMTVAENIAFDGLVGAPRLVNYRAIRETARAALAKLGVELDLGARLNKLPISGRQLVAIARALASDAKLIFMDEPTASLTQAETDHLLAVVRTLSASGVAVVFVSHRLAEVLDVSSRVTVLRDGRLVGVFDAAGMTQSRLTELMTGKRFDQAVTARDVGDAPIVVETSGLTRQGEYEDVNLTLRAGEVVGLIGLIGAGRTELAHTLFGMTRADAGSIRLSGSAVAFTSNREAIAAGIAYVSEDRLALGLVQPQSIADNTVITTLKAITGAGGLISEAKKSAAVDQARRRVRHQDRPAGRRRVDAVGRQSATRRACEVARHVAEGLDPRLPDGRRRRRRARRDLQNRSRARRTRHRHSDDLGRSHRGLLQFRPHPAHGGRTHRRGI